MYKLSIDIGTTTIKCVLFGHGLECIAQASREYATQIKQGNIAQQDPLDWWNGTVQTICEVLEKSGICAHEIKGVGISCQSPTFLPLGSNGAPLHDALIWMDRRADAECQELNEKLGKQVIFDITGNSLDASTLAPKILWFKKHQPEVLEKSTVLLQANSFIVFQLTGEQTADRSNASVTQLYDINTGDWSDTILAACGISRNMLPKISEGSDVVGTVSKWAAQQTGLAEGTPVIAGTVDALAGAMEAGVVSGGSAFEATGTSSVFLVAFDEIRATEHLSTAVGLGKNRGVMYGAMSTTGACYKWWRDKLRDGATADNGSYPLMNAQIEKDAPDPTNILFLPYMAGERSPIWDSNARGVFFGLDLNTSEAHMMRAIMEGACFALKDNIEAAGRAGVHISSLRSIGGCCQSELWLKIKASIIGLPIEIPRATFGSPAGLALILGQATGEFSSVEQAAEECVRIEKIIEPNAVWKKHYARMFDLYKSIYEHTKTDFSALATLND